MVNLAALRHAMWPRVPYLYGFEEDLSSLEGLSAEDLAALTELAGLSEEELEELQESQPDEKDEAIEKLKTALHKERTDRRKLAKELKALQGSGGGKPAKKAGDKGTGDDTDTEDDDKTTEELQRERQKSEKLAERFATNAVDTTILKVLGSGDKKLPQFQDSDDVIRMIDRSVISVDQEDDTPEQVEIDEDTVKDALKRLAKSKPHLLRKEKEGGEEEAGGGSKFGGGRKPPSEKDRQAELIKKYPALGRR